MKQIEGFGGEVEQVPCGVIETIIEQVPVGESFL